MALVSLRDARERAIARLSDAFARDELEMDEFERRLTLAHRAESVAELDGLLTDLEPASASAPASDSVALVPAPKPASPSRVQDRRRIVAVLAGTRRTGPWTPPRTLRVVAVLGGVELDFREASLASGVTELHVTACLGGVSIVVPPTLAVEMDGTAVLGGFEHSERAPAEPDPDRPLLRVYGLACLGGVNIETKLPGEPTEWDDHSHKRRALKAARREERRARRQLPPHEKG
jgi:hypothetical protein